VLLRVMHGLPKLDDVTRFQPWLTRITINVCRNYMARERREREKRFADPATIEITDPPEESGLEFTQMISQLSLDERTIVSMRILSDMEFAAIGEIVHMRLSAVKMAYYRALEKIKSRLG
jgi:RNA polymerase sigma-70 factor (ECF subfamily)